MKIQKNQREDRTKVPEIPKEDRMKARMQLYSDFRAAVERAGCRLPKKDEAADKQPLFYLYLASYYINCCPVSHLNLNAPGYYHEMLPPLYMYLIGEYPVTGKRLINRVVKVIELAETDEVLKEQVTLRPKDYEKSRTMTMVRLMQLFDNKSEKIKRHIEYLKKSGAKNADKIIDIMEKYL